MAAVSVSRCHVRCSAYALGVWTGRWAIGLQSARALVGNNRLQHVQPLIEQKFTPMVDCDTADVLLLSPLTQMRGPHVSVAGSEHTLLRLEGLKGKLWLAIGTSSEPRRVAPAHAQAPLP